MVFDQLDSQFGHEPFGKGMFDGKEFVNHCLIFDVFDIFNECLSIQRARFVAPSPSTGDGMLILDDILNFVDRLVSDGKIMGYDCFL